jgi:hypothetical protein
VTHDVVGADRHDRETACTELAREGDESLENVYHEGAVIADERDQEQWRAREIPGRDGSTGYGIRQSERRDWRTEGQHPRGLTGHGFSWQSTPWVMLTPIAR